uniref:DNA 3'-5' helicase n=1 Tax=Amphimedon queenslandica TaxID=400682 RepID=A0A1X7UI70_AMPQE
MLLSPPYKEKLVALVVEEAHCIKTWGDMFRVAFAELGQLRNITPTNTNVLCLTATATKETLSTVCKTMSLVDPIIIGTSSCRANIACSVKSLPTIDEFCSVISQEVKHHGLNYKKTIFCRSYSDCSTIYITLRHKLGENFVYPPGYPDFPEMYSRALTTEVKGNIKSSLRIVVATTAFGMGIDCPNIRQIIHYKSPPSLLKNLVELDAMDFPRMHVLYGSASWYSNKDMKDYAANSRQTSSRTPITLAAFNNE